MCWNAEVSLNTFVFSTFVLGMVIYNNTYTQYKIIDLKNVWFYVLFFSVICMQLVEFFIWRNIHNKYYNSFFSIGAFILLCIQPFFSLMLISNINIRNIMVGIYLGIVIPLFLYKVSNTPIYTIVTPKHHLLWNFADIKSDFLIKICWVLYLFFLLFSFFYNQYFIGYIFIISILLIVVYNFFQDNSIGSLWCWAININMFFYAFLILIYLPFCENKTIC
jgi:hypothetical protein